MKYKSYALTRGPGHLVIPVAHACSGHCNATKVSMASGGRMRTGMHPHAGIHMALYLKNVRVPRLLGTG